jgi:hypothetical protein
MGSPAGDRARDRMAAAFQRAAETAERSLQLRAAAIVARDAAKATRSDTTELRERAARARATAALALGRER